MQKSRRRTPQRSAAAARSDRRAGKKWARNRARAAEYVYQSYHSTRLPADPPTMAPSRTPDDTAAAGFTETLMGVGSSCGSRTERRGGSASRIAAKATMCFQDMLDVAARLVIRDVFDPDVGIERIAPASSGPRRSGPHCKRRDSDRAAPCSDRAVRARTALQISLPPAGRTGCREWAPANANGVPPRARCCRLHLHQAARISTRHRVLSEQALLSHDAEDPVPRGCRFPDSASATAAA